MGTLPAAGATDEIEYRLSQVLSEFAHTLVTDFPIQAILDHLVGRIVEVLPISGAGVTLISPGADPRYVAASDESALRFEQLQTELGDGPCLATYTTDEPVVIPDLRLDDRFPAFAPRAVDEGLVAVFTFPLRDGERRLGALDLYRTTPGALDPHAMAAAQTLADVASAYLLNAQARADLREASERARRRSLHDPLTGLPNRSLLIERLDHAMERTVRSRKVVAVLFADLDHFKSVNDTYGHHVGDELLVAVAARISALLRPGDTLARLAGDEFVILCEDLEDRDHIQPLANRIVEALAETYVLSGHRTQVSASIGIAFAGPGVEDPDQLLRDADTAMYQAKRQGGDRHATMDLGEQRVMLQRAGLRRDLATAAESGQLRLDYQPIVRTIGGRITGAEALLRWDHPHHGLVGPDTIIPLAEQSGLMGDVGRWVLDRACQDLQRWGRPASAPPFALAVNVSAQQLLSPGFTSTVVEVLDSTRTDPAQLILEITETTFIEDADRAAVVLADVKHLGLRLALDDFGTGYSSLSFLKRFPIDIVKIDRQFVARVDQDADDRAIVRGVVSLAHDLRFGVVAEGVETSQQHRTVQELGCESAQGYYFGRPAPADALTAMLGSASPHRPALPVLAPSP
ncbi:MAG: putative bifunctional diguanylate cyclase/phosphodiesterase [Acidimicrobiales bacterium]